MISGDDAALKCDFFGAGVVFEHVGLAVQSIQAVNSSLHVWHDPIQRVKVAFCDMNGIKVELIEPEGVSSPVTDALSKGRKLLHLCYKAVNLEAAMAEGRKHGFVMIAKPVPAVAFNGRRIAWMMHKSYGLIELLEQ